MSIRLLPKQTLDLHGSWCRTVIVGGGPVMVYSVRVVRDRLRGKWLGSVYRGTIRIWSGDVSKKMSTRGMLVLATVLPATGRRAAS